MPHDTRFTLRYSSHAWPGARFGATARKLIPGEEPNLHPEPRARRVTASLQQQEIADTCTGQPLSFSCQNPSLLTDLGLLGILPTWETHKEV